MTGIRRFEDCIAWQKSRALTADVYRVSGVGNFGRDFALRDQIRRAAISVMSNIAEGFDRYSRPEFRQFLSFARGSAAEVRSQLYVAMDLGYVDNAAFSKMKAQCEEVSRLIAAMRAKIGNQASRDGG